MSGTRVARGLPARTHVEERDGTMWVKTEDSRWLDDNGNEVNNAVMDTLLCRGAHTVVDQIDLETEDVPAYEVEAGEYVVLTWGWWYRPDEHAFFEENVSQQLWRVAGWSWHGPVTSTILLDAPEILLARTNFFMEPEEGWVRSAIEMYIDDKDVFRVVLPGQDHETWDWDWTDEHKMVGQRED